MTDLIDRLKRLGPVRVRSYRQLVQELWDLEKDAADRMTDWQPIETAPKDGTEVIAYDDGVYISHWYVTNPQIFGWWAGDAGGINPTHWMPLPTPPKSTEG